MNVCLCGYEFKVQIDEDGYFDELEEFRLIEIELINKSPFKWVSIFPSEKVLITSGFNSWAAVVSTGRRELVCHRWRPGASDHVLDGGK